MGSIEVHITIWVVTAFIALVVSIVLLYFSIIMAAIETALTRLTRSSLNDRMVQIQSDDSTYMSDFSRAKIVRRLDKIQLLIAHRVAASRACALYRVASNILLGVFVSVVGNLVLVHFWWVALIGVATAFIAALITVLVRTHMDTSTHPIDMIVKHMFCLMLIRVIVRMTSMRSVRKVAASSTEAVSEETLEKIHNEQRRALIDRLSENLDFDPETSEMLRNVLRLRDTLTREVMVPRTDMVTIKSTESLNSLLKLCSRSGFSRIPVIGSDLDDLLGIAYMKDAVRATTFNPNALERTVDSICRQPMLVPESKPVDDLFHDMQHMRQHVAMVVDEYGGIAGSVTIEDCLEQIVGEMEDEHDHSMKIEPQLVTERIWRMPARTPIAELEEIFEVSIDDDDVDTVFGLLTKLIGTVPIVGATACTHGLRLTALDSAGRRKKVSTIVVQPEQDTMSIEAIIECIQQSQEQSKS